MEERRYSQPGNSFRVRVVTEACSVRPMAAMLGEAKSVLKIINFCLHSNGAYFREENLCTGNKDMVKQSVTHAHSKSQKGCVWL